MGRRCISRLLNCCVCCIIIHERNDRHQGIDNCQLGDSCGYGLRLENRFLRGSHEHVIAQPLHG